MIADEIRDCSTHRIARTGFQGENKLDMANLDNLQASGSTGHVD